MTKALATIEKVRSMVTEASVKSEDMLRGLGIDRAVFERIAINAIVSNPDLGKCTPMSMFRACLKCAQSGLMPDGQHAALVPLKNKAGQLEATMWPMISGMLNKVRENLPNISITARSAYAADEFEEIAGTSPSIVHKPNPKADRGPENLFAVYAVVFHPGNSVPEFEVMYRPEIDDFKKRSRSTRGPWATNFAEMAEVRPLKRLLKRLPLSPNVMAIINAGNDDDFEEGLVVDEPREPEPTRAADEPIEGEVVEPDRPEQPNPVDEETQQEEELKF